MTTHTFQPSPARLALALELDELPNDLGMADERARLGR